MNKTVLLYLAIVVGALAISLDFASIDLALPALEKQFEMDMAMVQWVINGYVLAFAVLMVAGGRLADAYGRRRIFLLGLLIFALASAAGGAAWDGYSVILFRVLQGVGAALLWPAMIGLTCAMVGDSRRAFALGLIFGTCSVGNAAGPIVGGALTEWFSWRWVLWINIPMALFAMALTLWKVPSDTPPETVRPKNDFLGTTLLVTGLVATMIAVYQGQAWGWLDPRIMALTVVAILCLGFFPFVENRVPEPLVPPALLRNRELLSLCLCAMTVGQLFFVVMLYYTQYFIKFNNASPVEAGASVVPLMLSYGLVSYFSGNLTAWFGSRRLLLGGLLFTVLATALLTWHGPESARAWFVGSLVLLGIGIGSVVPTVSAKAIEAAGSARASLASGLVFMSQLSGAAVLLAVNTTVFTLIATSTLDQAIEGHPSPPSAGERVEMNDILTGSGTLRALPVGHQPAVLELPELVTSAYQRGLRVILGISFVLVLGALLVTARFVSNPPLPAGDTKE